MPPPLFQKVKKYLSITDIQKEIGFLHGILHCMKKNWESHGTISPINFGRELVILFVYKCDAISIFHSIFIFFAQITLHAYRHEKIWGFLVIVHRGSEAAHFVVAGRP